MVLRKFVSDITKKSLRGSADAYAWPLFTFDDTHKSLSACRSLLEDTKPRPRAKREEKRYARVSGWWVVGGWWPQNREV